MRLEKPIPAGGLVRVRVACAILGLSYDTLRFWLRKGWFEPPSGNTFAGHDLWSAEDIERLRLLRRSASRSSGEEKACQGARPAMRAAVYARVSTSNNGESPEMQLRDFGEYCDRRGWALAGEYVDI